MKKEGCRSTLKVFFISCKRLRSHDISPPTDYFTLIYKLIRQNALLTPLYTRVIMAT